MYLGIQVYLFRFSLLTKEVLANESFRKTGVNHSDNNGFIYAKDVTLLQVSTKHAISGLKYVGHLPEPVL